MKTKQRLLVLDDWEGSIEAAPCWAPLKERLEMVFLKEPIASAPDALIKDAFYLLAIRERTTLTSAVFDRLPQLKLVLQTGGHAYHIDTGAAHRRNISIALGRRVKAPLASVPELTFAMMLGLSHLVPQAQWAMRAGEWPLLKGRTLAGKRLGILGLGRHGLKVATIARNAFNMQVVAWARPGETYSTTGDFSRFPLDELLETSDVVSIHLKLSDKSDQLMNADRLARMKPGSFLINTSRGAIVDEDALIDALNTGKLAGAGLDVFNHEPLDARSRLRGMRNVLLTPHIGWTVEEVFQEFAQVACEQLHDYMNGTLSAGELLHSL
jgi:phosphoglycerate dehydrogenase-like enzyme